MMLYVKNDAGLQKIPYSKGDPIPDGTIWIDMLNITPDEETGVEKILKLEIPSREEMHEIELSSSLYQENNAVYMTATMITKSDTPQPETHAVTFVLVGKRLITIRYTDPMPFRQFTSKVEKLPDSEQNGQALFAGLLESIVERIADILERIGKDIDTMTHVIFRIKKRNLKSDRLDYQEMLEKIGRQGDRVSKTRESMVTLNRIVGYALQSPVANIRGDARIRLETIIKDIAALSDHAGFLSSKVNFLLDATLGMINIEQNNIIKIFSVAAVVFLPPTLIASVYGMNFDDMPELKWHLGYPLAVAMMIISSVLPYLYFKRRKWL